MHLTLKTTNKDNSSYQRSWVMRYAWLMILLLISIFYALPNLYGEVPALQITSNSTAFPLDNSQKEHIAHVLKRHHLPYRTIIWQNLHHQKSLLILFQHETTQWDAKHLLQNNLSPHHNVTVNLVPNTPRWLTALGAHPMKLGLDLRGGVHFLLAVDTHSMFAVHQRTDLQTMKQQLQQAKIHFWAPSEYVADTLSSPDADHDLPPQITLYFRTNDQLKQAYQVLSHHIERYHFTTTHRGGHYRLVGHFDTHYQAHLLEYTLEQAITTLRERVNQLGISEAVVQRQGSSSISVDLPGIQDMNQAKSLLGKTATLHFQLVDIDHHVKQVVDRMAIPSGSQLYDYEGRKILLKNRVVLTGNAITYATALYRNGQPAVNIHLKGGAPSEHFNHVTSENIGRSLAVVYVETKKPPAPSSDPTAHNPHPQHPRTVTTYKVISVATIQSALGNNFDINRLSNFSYASNLALLLRSGALPAPVSIVQEHTIGPSLGAKNISKGIGSLWIGSLLIFLFMAIYYRYFGLVANLALIANVIMIVAALSLLGATLTLPGMAGIVLTVGMAVDANVLINERIREELRSGVSPLASIQAGYARAFSTIVDANVTTLIVACILYGLGSGSIKGFAITLIIGLLASMVTAVVFTRSIIDLTYNPSSPSRRLSIGI